MTHRRRIRRLRHRSAHLHRLPKDTAPLVRFWMLRILMLLDARARFIAGIRDEDFEIETLADALQLEYDHKDGEHAWRQLQKLHVAAEKDAARTAPPQTLRDNIAELARTVNLSDTDCRILEFTALLHGHDELLDACVSLVAPKLSARETIVLLAALLDLPEREVKASLKPSARLYSVGLLEKRIGHAFGDKKLSDRLELLSEDFVETLFLDDARPIDFLKSFVTPCDPPQLALKDYQHLDGFLKILRPYLKKSIAQKSKAVNILLHGLPGTGKTQLAQVLARDLRCDLFDINAADEDGDPLSGNKRLTALCAAQNILPAKNSLIVFDEVEDILPSAHSFFGFPIERPTQSDKHWVNRILEQNPVPTFWISNSSARMDAALLRRFSLVLELPVPPQQQRQKIIRENCADFLDEKSIAAVAEAQHLAPAAITRAAEVITAIGDDLAVDAPTAFVNIINNTLHAQSRPKIRLNPPNALPAFYSLDFVNTDVEIKDLAAGLAKNPSARICFYGPPGTGKTAFANYLAKKLDLTLHVKRVSDLISAYVGATEQNIARAFHQAEQENAMLLIDEVDSFLQDRRGAQRSWETTRVNEMLTQMESFAGIFIASTNLVGKLDQASLRRFDAKIKFDFLRAEQIKKLFAKHCKALDLSRPSTALQTQLGSITNLTPGDFAAVARHHRFHEFTNAAQLFDALCAECSLKEGGGQRIGFV